MNQPALFLILLLPLLGGAINAIFGLRFSRQTHGIIAVTATGLAFLTCLSFWPLAQGEGTRAILGPWLHSGGLQVDFGILFDPLAATMALMVTGVSTLIHLYAVGYMEHEKGTARFFALLNLFVFAMLTIVLADNLLFLFLGWEGVGFCSYGLIGFWHHKLENARAGQKAFLVTRIGDVFLAIAFLWLFASLGSVGIPEINARVTELPAGVLTILTILLLVGACGKSAQLPLMTWLPDAMAGPTPVSALIHAATMVTAGVYLLCRLFPLISLSPTGMTLIALVGGLTAFYAASCALAQREIKRVLAYSTMSQIGYMFLGIGAGTLSGAMFHLYCHAFFKALLFMGAGCVIHLCGEENDIYKMGGVTKKNPLVFAMMLIGLLCLAGAPLTSGFFSKDGILAAAYLTGDNWHRLAWGLGMISALMTSFYSFRLLFLVFPGPPRHQGKTHKLPILMTLTLLPLAVLSLGGGLLNLPEVYKGHAYLSHLLEPEQTAAHIDHATEYALAVSTACLFLLGLLGALALYRPFPGERPAWYKNFLLKGWQADWLAAWAIQKPFAAIGNFCHQGIDRIVIEGLLAEVANGAMRQGERLRQLTTGRVSTYLAGFGWGLLLILGWLLLAVVKG